MEESRPKPAINLPFRLVIPAQAGTQAIRLLDPLLDPRLRGDDCFVDGVRQPRNFE
jgi:hypothetical protein